MPRTSGSNSSTPKSYSATLKPENPSLQPAAPLPRESGTPPCGTPGRAAEAEAEAKAVRIGAAQRKSSKSGRSSPPRGAEPKTGRQLLFNRSKNNQMTCASKVPHLSVTLRCFPCCKRTSHKIACLNDPHLSDTPFFFPAAACSTSHSVKLADGCSMPASRAQAFAAEAHRRF